MTSFVDEEEANIRVTMYTYFINLLYRVVGPCRLSISVDVSKVVPKHVIM